MEVTLSGMVTEVREVQPWNAYGQMSGMPMGIFTVVKEAQCWKAELLM
jgi:hypothetical protein